MSNKITIKKAAVLGAGVMGAQIAAFLVNAGVSTKLYDLPSSGKDSSEISRGAVKALSKLRPSPLALPEEASLIEPCNYETDLEKLQECDFIIEAISERKSYKLELYEKILPFIHDKAIVATNTSGISITELSKAFPDNVQKRFLGVHFFNPPRYMKLVECIPHKGTDTNLVDALEEFLVVRLGKGVVYAKDTPNFVGNRVGVFAMLSVLKHAQTYNLAPDVVDALTGPLIGRPRSATYRTMDVVGLDTMKHVIQTLKEDLKDDPFKDIFELPAWIDALVSKGALGQKTRQGVYKKQGEKIFVFDPSQSTYRPAQTTPPKEIVDIFKQPPGQSLPALKESNHPAAQFLWACFRDLFHYCAYTLPEIAENTRDVDLALRWGYGWQQGPFEFWQRAGASTLSKLINEDIQAGKALGKQALPDWINQSDDKAFYKESAAFSPNAKTYQKRKQLPFYERQLDFDRVLEEPAFEGKVIFENNGLQMWHLNDGNAIVSFKTKKNCISQDVLEGMIEAVDRAEKEYESLIIWQKNGPDFSVGANLKEITAAIQAREFSKIDNMISLFHQVAMRLKYASIPTLAAITGMSLGGGTEFALHTHKRVAAFESYIGLPEVGIGVIPAGGGCKELAMDAYRYALQSYDLKPLEKVFEQVAKAEVSSSSKDAQRRWYLRPFDKQVVNKDEVLFEAIREANALKGPNFYPQLPQAVSVAGKTAYANFLSFLTNMREGQFISDHDYTIGSKLANVFSGGQVDEGTFISEQRFLDLEKAAFMELVESPLTLARIEHTLKTGKPLRN